MSDDEEEADVLGTRFGDLTTDAVGNGFTINAQQTHVGKNQTNQNAKNRNQIYNSSDAPGVIRAFSEVFKHWQDKVEALVSENATKDVKIAALRPRLASLESTDGSDSAALSRQTTPQASLSRESSLSEQGGVAVPAPLPSISISDAYFQVLQSLQIRANEIIA